MECGIHYQINLDLDGPLTPCFGHLMMSPLCLKARVGNIIHSIYLQGHWWGSKPGPIVTLLTVWDQATDWDMPVHLNTIFIMIPQELLFSLSIIFCQLIPFKISLLYHNRNILNCMYQIKFPLYINLTLLEIIGKQVGMGCESESLNLLL